MTEPQRVMGMIGAVRPTRIDIRVVKPLLKVVDHSLLVVVRGIGENTDVTSHLRDFIPVVITDCRGNVHLQQANHALLVFIRYRAFKGGFDVILTEAATADWTGPSKGQMSSTQQPSAHQTNAALSLMEARSALGTYERYDIHCYNPATCPANVRNEPRAAAT